VKCSPKKLHIYLKRIDNNKNKNRKIELGEHFIPEGRSVPNNQALLGYKKGDNNKMNINQFTFNRRSMRIVEIGNKNYISLSDLELKNRPDENRITAISVFSGSGYLPLEIIPLENAINLTENTKLKEFLESM
jgi:hypothetical protein